GSVPVVRVRRGLRGVRRGPHGRRPARLRLCGCRRPGRPAALRARADPGRRVWHRKTRGGGSGDRVRDRRPATRRRARRVSRAAAGRAARGSGVLSVCTGAFVLAAAGLLDGRRCTTHWLYAADLARCCPGATVDPGVLYVDADPVITSAGSAADIDACLYLVRKEQGTKVANQIARRMVVAPHRDGGQAQFVDRPLPVSPADTLAEVTSWLERHLDRQVTVAELAALAHMSPRTFARRFVQETGTTPLRWLTGQRIL